MGRTYGILKVCEERTFTMTNKIKQVVGGQVNASLLIGVGSSQNRPTLLDRSRNTAVFFCFKYLRCVSKVLTYVTSRTANQRGPLDEIKTGYNLSTPIEKTLLNVCGFLASNPY